MRLKDIEAMIPNGFHDAKIVEIHRNIRDDLAILEIDVLVGLPDDEPKDRDRYRHAILIFRKAKLVIIDPPDPESSFRFPAASGFVITEDEEETFPDELLKQLQPTSHNYTIFVQKWFSSIRIAAADIEFAWK